MNAQTNTALYRRTRVAHGLPLAVAAAVLLVTGAAAANPPGGSQGWGHTAGYGRHQSHHDHYAPPRRHRNRVDVDVSYVYFGAQSGYYQPPAYAYPVPVPGYYAYPAPAPSYYAYPAPAPGYYAYPQAQYTPPAYSTGYGGGGGYYASGCNPVLGSAVGAALGGFLGSQIGKGSGQLAATSAGTIGGLLIGQSAACR